MGHPLIIAITTDPPMSTDPGSACQLRGTPDSNTPLSVFFNRFVLIHLSNIHHLQTELKVNPFKVWLHTRTRACKIDGGTARSRRWAQTLPYGAAGWSKPSLVPVETWEKNVPGGARATKSLPCSIYSSKKMSTGDSWQTTMTDDTSPERDYQMKNVAAKRRDYNFFIYLFILKEHDIPNAKLEIKVYFPHLFAHSWLKRSRESSNHLNGFPVSACCL